MTDQRELLTMVRELVGGPDPNAVSNRQLERYVERALDSLAEELSFMYRTEEQAIALVTGQAEYPLPDDLVRLIWVEWGGNNLLPSSTQRWERDRTNWRRSISAAPSEYALLGRTLVLYPNPDAASVAVQASLPIRYVAAGPGVLEAGCPGLGDQDRSLLEYQAAYLYLTSRPGADQATLLVNGTRIKSYAAEIERRLRRAKQRWQDQIRPYYRETKVRVTRRGTAR